MAIQFIVEDGTGKEDSNSYIDLVYFKQVMDNMGVDYSSKTDDQLSISAIKATSYMERTFYYGGTAKLPRVQALKWPRINAVDKAGNAIAVNTVPREALKATALAAIIDSTDPTGLDYIKPVEGTIKSTSSALGPLKDATEYADGSQTSLARIFVDVEQTIKPITSSGYGLLPTTTERF